jgi:hypothetical protein
MVKTTASARFHMTSVLFARVYFKCTGLLICFTVFPEIRSQTVKRVKLPVGQPCLIFNPLPLRPNHPPGLAATSWWHGRETLSRCDCLGGPLKGKLSRAQFVLSALDDSRLYLADWRIGLILASFSCRITIFQLGF